MIALLTLLACAGAGSKSPSETAESAPADTADSTVVSETATETAESDSDTADTTDTAPYTEWNPGDEVPGWEDVDCTEPHPGRSYTMTFDDVFLAEARFLAGMPGVGPHLLTLQIRDCINFPCLPEALNLRSPYLEATLDATAGDDGVPRALGEWGPDASTHRQVTADALSMLLDWDNGALSRVPAEVTVCFERVRPDEVRGTVRAEVFDYPYGFVNYYPSLVYRYPFDITYPERSGFDATLPDAPADMPDGYATAHFIYEESYDAAWPWDEIADLSIRQQLYERYAPYNAP